jgi:hypothetical protein
MDLVIFAVCLLALAIASLLWGADSTDSLDSPEWERRRGWPGPGGGDSPY